MSTLVKPFVIWVSYLSSATTVLWILTLVCGRLLALHTMYNIEVMHYNQQAWLREQCKDPVFYRNITMYSNICAEVEENAAHSIFFFCLTRVMQETYLCGEHPCMYFLEHCLDWFAQLSLPVMLAVFFCLMFCPVVLVQLIRLLVEVFRPSYHYQNPHNISYSFTESLPFHHYGNLRERAHTKAIAFDMDEPSRAYNQPILENAVLNNFLLNANHSTSSNRRPGHQYAVLSDDI